MRIHFPMIIRYLSTQKVVSLGLLLSVVISVVASGCNGRASQMARLKRKMGAGNLPAKKKDKDEESADKSPSTGEKSKSSEHGKQNDGRKSGKSVATNSKANLNSMEAQNAKSASTSSGDFIQFRKSMVKKLNERRASLNQYQKLNAVALAFRKYVEDQRQYPSATINGKSYLSWRVELLPYLGYPELYEKFDIESRYNSPLNNRLIDLMPPEYETTSEKGKTTLLAPIDSFTAYRSNRPTLLLRLEDGVSDTVGIIDVDESKATTWTRPTDLELKQGKEIFEHLGGKYSGQFIVIFGDGRLEKVSITSDPRDFTAMLSYDRGDSYPANLLTPVEESDLNKPDNQLVESGSSTPNSATNAKSNDSNENETKTLAADDRRSTSSNSLPTNPYSARLKQLETDSLLDGDQATAMKLNYARILIEDDSVAFGNYRWCKALQRPAMSLRWQIGISLGDAKDNTNPIKRAVDRQINVQRPGTKTLEKKTGQIGLDSAIVLRKLVDDGLMGKIMQEHSMIVSSQNQASRPSSNRDGDNRRKKLERKSTDEELFDSRKQPDLHHSGVEVAIGSSRSYHLQVARERGIDLLLLLEIELRRIRNKTMNTTTLFVIDVQRGKELMKSATLNNLKIEQERDNHLKEDAVFTAMKKLDKFARENIALSEFPQNIARTNVLKRLALLIAKKDNDVLKFLAEGRLYLEKGLILEDDYKQFCQEILKDSEAGLAMAIGAPEYRFDAIKPLLPKKLNLNFR